jgi:rubredoxin
MMSIVVSYDEIDLTKIKPNKGGNGAPASTNYVFFRASKEDPVAPTAFLAQYPPDEHSSAHYHAVDQFQILVKGSGDLGRHSVKPYYLHFSRAYTPYGPLHSDAVTGWTFMTLRARFDAGAQRLSDKLEVLKAIPHRRPWQVTTQAVFPPESGAVSYQPMPEVSDDNGLSACAFTMAPQGRTTAPSAADSDGLYIVALHGSLLYGGVEKQAMTVVFVKPDEPAFEMVAGAAGCQGLILKFPRVTPMVAQVKPAVTAAGYKKWQCVLCAFFYDEALGMPEEGIPAGTRWADVPETWNCPDCAASKSDFEMVEV